MNTSHLSIQQQRSRAAKRILTILGLIHIPLIGFHFAFPTLFGWQSDLSRLTSDNRDLFWALHLCAIFWLGSMGTVTLWEGLRQNERQGAALPSGFWIWMTSFWVFRIAIQIPVEGLNPRSLAMIAVLLPIPALYLLAWKKLQPDLLDVHGFTGPRLRPESWLR